MPGARESKTHSPTRTHSALRALGNLLRAARRTLPIPVLSRCASLTTLFSFLILFPTVSSAALAQSQPLPDESHRQTDNAARPEESAQRAGQPQQGRFGVVSGRVVDQTAAGLAGANLRLKCDEESTIREMQSDEDGRFSFDNVPPGPFQLTTVAEGFASQTISNTLQPGENFFVPPITMHLATLVTEVRVSPPSEEIAQSEFKELEHQRVLGIVPNFYVSYAPDAAPLTAKRKFQLTWKASTDPVTTVGVGIIAGVGQATDRFSAYGQGAGGYGKRYGASYANFASGLWIGGAVLPSILKQDPRYFYKGTGSKHSRFLYAISRPFVCKGDNHRWQPNYSSVLGDLAAGGISNLYIPERDHHGARLTFENAGIALGTTMVIDVLQEFVLHGLTSIRH